MSFSLAAISWVTHSCLLLRTPDYTESTWIISHLKLLYLIISAKFFLPCKVTCWRFWALGHWHLWNWGGHYSVHYSVQVVGEIITEVISRKSVSRHITPTPITHDCSFLCLQGVDPCWPKATYLYTPPQTWWIKANINCCSAALSSSIKEVLIVFYKVSIRNVKLHSLPWQNFLVSYPYWCG